MRYAVISDIHGNLGAFHAVMEDAEKQEVDGYFFLGDYGGLGNTNDIVGQLRALPGKYKAKEFHLISGNGDDYIRQHYDAAMVGAFPMQNAPIHYECSHIITENRMFLANLPGRVRIETEGVLLCAAHKPSELFGHSSAELFSGRGYVDLMREGRLKNCSYNDYIRNELEQDHELRDRLRELEGEVFLFGHYHTQWHARVQGKLLINPGACGMPCDFQTTAPYCILAYENKQWEVYERRVPYDVGQVMEAFRKSDAYAAMNIWSELYLILLETGINAPLLFVEHAYDVMRDKGEHTAICSNETWQEAVQSFQIGELGI